MQTNNKRKIDLHHSETETAMPPLDVVQGPISEVFLLPTDKITPDHELFAHQRIGEVIAKLLSAEFKGSYEGKLKRSDQLFSPLDPTATAQGNAYLIPNDTLIGHPHWNALGITSVDNFFGGLVSEPFMATKAISHPLLDKDCFAPNGWSEAFSQKAQSALLKGYTAFTLTDAENAAIKLLHDGPVRIKPVRATAGRGQIVVQSIHDLNLLLPSLDEKEISTWGITLEEDLHDVVTYSVGQVRVAGLIASYVGTQCLTHDNEGECVYGGSDLIVARGEYSELSQLALPENVMRAIAQAQTYESAAFDAFPQLVASRRNYDVAQGLDAREEFRSGVLEQSWRIGGASGAEIFALKEFHQDPSLNVIRASTHEIYGDIEPPVDATILYRGDDAEVGRITKFVKVHPYVHTN